MKEFPGGPADSALPLQGLDPWLKGIQRHETLFLRVMGCQVSLFLAFWELDYGDSSVSTIFKNWDVSVIAKLRAVKI